MLSPDEIREIKDYIMAQRQSDMPFNIAVNVVTDLNHHQNAEIVQPFFEAGATGCIELAPETPEQYLARIRAGPPKR